MGKTLSSSPAWAKASWISWKNSGSRDGATVAAAWRRAGSDRAGMGISGSLPCGFSAVISARLLSRQQQDKPYQALEAVSGYSSWPGLCATERNDCITLAPSITVSASRIGVVEGSGGAPAGKQFEPVR